MKNDNVKCENLSLSEFLVLTILFLLPFYFIKIKYSWVSLNLIEILTSALFLIWIFNKEKKYPIHNTQYTIPTILIIAGLLLSTFINKNYYVGFGIIKGWFILPIIFAIVLYDNLKKNKELLGWSLAAIFLSGVLVATSGIYYWMSGLLTYDGRLAIFFDSPNQLAMYLAVPFLIGIFFTLWLTKLNFRKFLKFNFSIGLLLIGSNLYLTKSYGAWLALAVALTVIFWLVYGKLMRRQTVVFLLIFIIILLAWGTSIKLKNIESEGMRSSLASREMIWKSSVLMIRDNPLFGIGPGNFQNTYLEYQKYFPPYLEWAVPQPHNLFLAFWLEAGFAGLIGFIWLLALFFRDNKRAIGNNRSYGILCLAVMLYFLIHGLVDTTYWRNDMAILFWVIIATNLYFAGKTRNQEIKVENVG